MKRPNRVLVAIDESPAAWRALTYALRRAANGNGQVTVLSVLDSRAASLAVRVGGGQSTTFGLLTERLQSLFQKARGLAAMDGISIDTRMTASSSDAADGIVRAAREGLFDEVVIGQRERRGLETPVLGSTALRIMATCEVPVTIVP